MHWTQNPKWADKLKEMANKLKGRKPNSGSFKKGDANPFKGKKLPWIGHNKPHTEETKSLISKNRKGKFTGEQNHKWKGDDVGSLALHGWVKRQLGFPTKCEKCGFESDNCHKLHWANKSHKYLRDINDWIRLCVSCHKKYDLEFKKNNSII